MYNDLVNLQSNLNGKVNGQIDDINTTSPPRLPPSTSLSPRAQKGTSEANDYLDQRNQLLQQLSGYMNISYFTDSSNMVNVLTSKGATLVEGVTSYQLTIDPDTTNGMTRWGGRGRQAGHQISRARFRAAPWAPI